MITATGSPEDPPPNYQRDMRRQGQWQVATMANEMLRLQPGEQPDTRRMRPHLAEDGAFH
jgi:hypothetical protein